MNNTDEILRRISDLMFVESIDKECDSHGMTEHKGSPKYGHKCVKCENERKAKELKENTYRLYETYKYIMKENGVNPNGKRFDEWEFDAVQADRQKKIIQTLEGLAEKLIIVRAGDRNAKLPNILLVGGTGSGKTMLSNALAKAVYRKAVMLDISNSIESYQAGNKCAKLIKSRDITEQAKATWGDYQSSEYQLIEHLARFELLIIDDLGDNDTASNEDMAANDRGRVGQILDKRYQKYPTVITTNLDIEQVAGHLGDRAWDRLQENLIIIKCDWASYRQSVAKVAYL